MHVQRASSYSNIKTELERPLKDDRQVLVEEQKACRARARKFSLETNRRRRALEEKRREEDIREQKLREDILQQRKQKVQEATERFQRAHLPPSQRNRQVYRNPTPRLEEALNQIQPSFSSSALNSSLYSRSPISNRTYTSSPSSSASSTASHYQKQLSAAVAYAKLMQEKSGTNLKSSQMLFQNELLETQRLLEERKMNSLQDFEEEIRQLDRSESLSSLDSLENEQSDQIPRAGKKNVTYSSAHEFVPRNCTQPQLQRKHFNGTCPAAKINFLKAEKISHDPWNQDSMMYTNSQTHVMSKRTEELSTKYLNNTQQAITVQRTNEAYFEGEKEANINAATLSSQNTLTENKNVDTSSNETSRDKTHDDFSDNCPKVIPSKAWSTPDPTPKEIQFSTQEDESRQQVKNPADRYSNQPLATQIVLPTNQISGEENLSNKSASPGTLLKIVNKSCTEPDCLDVSLTENPKCSHCPRTNQIDPIYSKNYNDKSENCESEKSIDVESSNHVTDSHRTKSSISKTPLTPGEERQKLSDAKLSDPPSTSVGGTKGINVVKGILKKESKYASGHASSALSSSSVHFTKQVAKSIRDSVELTKLKDKDLDNSKTKKKLRWFDEIGLNESDEVNKQNQARSKLFHQSTVKNNIKDISTERQESQFRVSATPSAPGASKTAQTTQVTTPLVSTGYHFTKQAWADSEHQDSKLQEQGMKSQLANACQRKGRPRVPRRVRSAKARLGTAPSKTRRGTIIRPQSASEANHVLKSQGKMIKPSPPPRPIFPQGRQVQSASSNEETVGRPTRNLYNDTQTFSKGSMPVEQASYKDIPDGCALPQGSSFTTASVTFTPFPPSYTLSSCETVTKATYTVNSILGGDRQEALTTRRGPIYGENGLRLDHTPTDEEILQLWHGVRSALATKDGDSRNISTHNGLLSVVPQARANLSHVTIDGGSLIGGVKSLTRMGGFFASPSNAFNVARRKQILDSNGAKHRALLEQRRQATDSVSRKPVIASEGTVQISPLPSKPEQAQMPSDEVSESTAQFLLAENLTETSASDSEILRAMEMVHSQKHTFLLNRAQHLGLSALSLEEQKLLHSLEHLNHRLLRKTAFTHPLQLREPLSSAISVHFTNKKHNSGRYVLVFIPDNSQYDARNLLQVSGFISVGLN
nr:PREDICTED: centrosomal protein of 126 kDa isoform X2 [Lepisosteus oculatus]